MSNTNKNRVIKLMGDYWSGKKWVHSIELAKRMTLSRATDMYNLLISVDAGEDDVEIITIENKRS